MSPLQWLSGLVAAPPEPPAPEPGRVSWQGVLDAYTATYGAHKAATHLAAAMGVTRRTAERYRSGEIAAPTRTATRAAAENLRADIERRANERRQQEWRAEVDAIRARHRAATATKLRGITSLDPGGKVQVKGNSGPLAPRNKFRRIGALGRVAAGLDRVATAWEQGAYGKAAQELSDTIIARYAGESATSRNGLARTLTITDFPRGLGYA